MAFETLVKRTTWVSECGCSMDVKVENPPRERFCSFCKGWFPYVENSYVGPELPKKV